MISKVSAIYGNLLTASLPVCCTYNIIITTTNNIIVFNNNIIVNNIIINDLRQFANSIFSQFAAHSPDFPSNDYGDISSC